MTSSIVKSPCTYNPGSNSLKSFLLNLTSYMVDLGSKLLSLILEEYPNFCDPRADF